MLRFSCCYKTHVINKLFRPGIIIIVVLCTYKKKKIFKCLKWFLLIMLSMAGHKALILINLILHFTHKFYRFQLHRYIFYWNTSICKGSSFDLMLYFFLSFISEYHDTISLITKINCCLFQTNEPVFEGYIC